MLQFCDSFDGYTAIADKWLAVPACNLNGNGAGIGTGSVRTGVRGMRIQNDQFGNPGGMRRTLPTGVDTIVVGFAYRRNGLGAGDCLQLWEGFGTTQHFKLMIESNNKLGVYRAGTKLGEGVTAIPQNVWTYIEVKVKIHDTTGTVEVRVNGAVDLSLTGQDTRNAGTAGLIDDIRLFNVYGQAIDVDDIVVMDTSGSTMNDFIGDIKIECILPGGNGNSSQFVGSDADSTNNFQLVDDNPPNDDTDYVQSSTVGQKDTYAYGNLATPSGTVYGVQVSSRVRKDDAGARKFVSVARLSSTEEDSAEYTLTTSYQYFAEVRPTKPGGGAWTITDVNNAEFGVKVST